MKLDTHVISRLIIKDWRLHEKMIAAYFGLGIFGLVIVGMPHLYAVNMGAILLVTVVVGAGFHTISATVLQEHKDQTLPFIMSLPVRPEEYFLAKACINLLIFGLHWLLVFAGLVFVTLTLNTPAGMLPLFILVSAQLLVHFVVTLCVAVQTGKEGISILTMVFGNIVITPFIILIANNPDFNQYFGVDQFVWPGSASLILTVQLAIIAATLVVLLLLQTRRRTFI